MAADRYVHDYGTRSTARGRRGREGVDAAARRHKHDPEDTRGLPEALAALAAVDAILEAAIEALPNQMLVHEDGEVLTNGVNVLMTEET